MKKIFTFFLIALMTIVAGQGVFAQGLEDFTNYPETGNAYHDGTFTGLDGSTWSYFQSRGDSVITAPTPILGKNRVPTSEVTSGLISGGIGTLSFDYKQVFSSNVALDVKVNGVLITTVTTAGEQGIVKNTGPINVSVSGTVTIDFIQNSTTAGQVAIDNVTWTAFGGGSADPEPTNYPTSFTASGAGLSINAEWSDATGAQIPSGYLVKISKTNNITAPVDGTFTGDDLNLADGSGAKNVLPDVQQFNFKGLEAATTYYLKIFPYTNAGSQVDYKTDGTVPSADSRTQSILSKQDFSNGLSPWTAISVSGTQEWVIDSIHGVDGSFCTKMSGYAASVGNVNEDWLISPKMVIPAGSAPTLEFYSAMNYGVGTDGLKVKFSTDYNSGDPSTGTWTDVTTSATLSAGGWVWTSSGFLGMSSYTGSNTHIAFVYTCGTTSVPTWELDNITVTFNSGVGIPGANKNTGVSIYPNPCFENCAFTLPTTDVYQVTVYNAQGSVVMSDQISKSANKLNIQQLKSGIYMVSVMNTSTNQQEMLKMIVK